MTATGEKSWNSSSCHHLTIIIIIIIVNALVTVCDSEICKPIHRTHSFYLIQYNLPILRSLPCVTALLFGKRVKYKSNRSNRPPRCFGRTDRRDPLRERDIFLFPSQAFLETLIALGFEHSAARLPNRAVLAPSM